MDIKDTNKISNLDILDTKFNFKILELEGINLDDDWSKLSKLKNLETLILQDSYIDFKKFYNAIFSLKKLNLIVPKVLFGFSSFKVFSIRIFGFLNLNSKFDILGLAKS